MTRIMVLTALVAFVVGALFKAHAIFGFKYLNMAGMIGLVIVGAGGTMALTRWQAAVGRRAVEIALISLGPGYIITDWAEGRGPRGAPDYVVIGPGAIAAITLETVGGTALRRLARNRIATASQKATVAATWVKDRLGETGIGDSVPIVPVVVLTRRRATPPDTASGAVVASPHMLRGELDFLAVPERLDESERVKLTRTLRRHGRADGKQALRNSGLWMTD